MRVLITGAFGAIGSAIALDFAQRGDSLILLDRVSGPECHSTETGNLYAEPWRIEECTYVVDFRRPDQVEKLLISISMSEDVDILINCAGVQHIGAIQDQSLDVWSDVMNINLTASFLTMKYLLPGMCQRGFGRVINVSSVHGLVASLGKAPYVSSKHGLVGLTKVAALEVAGCGDSDSGGVTVNAICPGWVDTPLLDEQVAEIAKSTQTSREDALAEMLAAKQPSPRLTKPSDVARLVAFLCEPTSHNITGASIPIDGGWISQ